MNISKHGYVNLAYDTITDEYEVVHSNGTVIGHYKDYSQAFAVAEQGYGLKSPYGTGVSNAPRHKL